MLVHNLFSEFYYQRPRVACCGQDSLVVSQKSRPIRLGHHLSLTTLLPLIMYK